MVKLSKKKKKDLLVLGLLFTSCSPFNTLNKYTFWKENIMFLNRYKHTQEAHNSFFVSVVRSISLTPYFYVNRPKIYKGNGF